MLLSRLFVLLLWLYSVVLIVVDVVVVLVQVFWCLFLLFCWYCSVKWRIYVLWCPLQLVSFSFMYSRKREQEVVILFLLPNLSSSCSFSRPLSLFVPLLLVCCLSRFSFRGKSAPPLRTYKGPWHLISCLWCSFTLFLCVILSLLHLYPSPSHSHTFLLFFFVISLLSAHNPWFYLKLFPSEHYGIILQRNIQFSCITFTDFSDLKWMFSTCLMML